MALRVTSPKFGQSGFGLDAPDAQSSRSLEVTARPLASDDPQPAHETPVPRKRGPLPGLHEDAAKRSKSAILGPYFDPCAQISDTNGMLRRINSELAAMSPRQKQNSCKTRDQPDNEARPSLLLTAPEIAREGRKRQASASLVSPMKVGSLENGTNEHTTAGHLVHLANQIYEELDKAAPQEQIHLCGLGPLKIMDTRPDEVLDLAHQKLHTWPYKSVPMCWRRLYEDATLSKAANMLHEEADRIGEAVSFKRRRLDLQIFNADHARPQFLTEIVTVLDKGITLTGAPGRASVFEAVLQQLENHLTDERGSEIPTVLLIKRPRNLPPKHAFARAKTAMGFEAFQQHLDHDGTPLVISGAMSNWPALRLWQNPTYLLRVTLGGRRLVPVELGKSYLDPSWSQRMMPFREFMTDYLLPDEPKEVGYLAQHDLFAQIPALKNDITTPDYCYTSPPDPMGNAANTAGLASALRLDEPLLNAWLGPKGTKTPLHTDPYHNILCQVIGYKYVRLYAPSETPKLYPCGPDDNGVDMSNTSQVDVSKSRTVEGTAAESGSQPDFPMFAQAEFVEGVIGPGEILYIPLGWWHYIESLSTSFSVSFWWN